MEKNNRDSRGVLITAEGLRTSACLIALRQEIWSVVMYRRPVRLPLADSSDYSSLGPADDFTWANRVVLWCADVLRFCFGPRTGGAETHSDSRTAHDEWTALKAFDERWTAYASSCFRPMFYSPASPERGEFFPTIWHFNHTHIVAVQHLHLGRMLLTLHEPQSVHLAPQSNTSSLTIKEKVRRSVKTLCGLGLGDRHFQSGMTTAAIGISIGGAFFEDTLDRSAIVGFLEDLELEHAWPTRSMVESLRAAWAV